MTTQKTPIDDEPVSMADTMDRPRRLPDALDGDRWCNETAIEFLGDVTYALDGDGRFEAVDEALLAFTGYAREELLGEHLSILVDEAAVETGEATIGKLLDDRGREAATVEVELLTATGDRVPYENRLRVLRAASGAFQSLVGVLQVTSDRTKDRGRATELHDATRRMRSAETAEEIGEIAVEAARSTLGLRICTLWLYDATEEALRPIASIEEATALLDTFPTYTAGNSVSWGAFVEGEARVYEDLSTEPDRHDPDTPIRSEMILPLREFGILNAGSTRVGAFDAADGHVAKLLAANAEAALGRADREERLRSREAELRRQNARLEEFASVVSHDLRNPRDVITGTLELVRETGDLEGLEPIERATDRVERLTTALLTLARQGRTVGDCESVRLEPIVEDAWAGVALDRASARLVVDRLSDESTASGTIEGDPTGLQQLFGSLFANAIEHGGPEVVVEVGSLPDVAGFYVADDGPSIDPARRERVFGHDYTTSEQGIGVGLTIVETVVGAHGWELTVTESERGGARFEIRTG